MRCASKHEASAYFAFSSPPKSATWIAAFNDDSLDLAGTLAAKGGSTVVFRRGEAGDALLEGRKLNHHEALELVGAFHDLIAAAARHHLAAELGDDTRHEVGVLLVFDGIIDLRSGNPIGRHGGLLADVFLRRTLSRRRRKSQASVLTVLL